MSQASNLVNRIEVEVVLGVEALNFESKFVVFFFDVYQVNIVAPYVVYEFGGGGGDTFNGGGDGQYDSV